MTRYVASPKAYPDMPDYRDANHSLMIEGYDYEPATPNPDDCAESYRPVTLQWRYPNEPFGVVTMGIADNEWRANRTYRITTPGATQTYGIAVNGIHIPVQFNTIADAQLFAQAIEDANTES